MILRTGCRLLRIKLFSAGLSGLRPTSSIRDLERLSHSKSIDLKSYGRSVLRPVSQIFKPKKIMSQSSRKCSCATAIPSNTRKFSSRSSSLKLTTIASSRSHRLRGISVYVGRGTWRTSEWHTSCSQMKVITLDWCQVTNSRSNLNKTVGLHGKAEATLSESLHLKK